MTDTDQRARPLVVHLYVALELIALVVGLVTGGALHPASALASVVIAAIIIAVIRGGSQVGWSILVALTLLFLPFDWKLAHHDARGAVLAAIQVAELLVLLSPWMVRWIWRRPRVSPA